MKIKLEQGGPRMSSLRGSSVAGFYVLGNNSPSYFNFNRRPGWSCLSLLLAMTDRPAGRAT